MILLSLAALAAAQISPLPTIIPNSETTVVCLFPVSKSLKFIEGTDGIAVHLPQGAASAPLLVEIVDPSSLLKGASLVSVRSGADRFSLTSTAGLEPWMHLTFMRLPSKPTLFAAVGEVSKDGGDRLGNCSVIGQNRAQADFDYYRTHPASLVRHQ